MNKTGVSNISGTVITRGISSRVFTESVCNMNINGKYDFLKHFTVYYKNRRIGYCLYGDCFYIKDLEEEESDFKALYREVAEENIISIKVLLSSGFHKKTMEVIEK